MSKIDMINAEISRRQSMSSDLIAANKNIVSAIEQFNKLDEMYRSDEKSSRDRLEALYKEARHFNNLQPIVYSFSQTEFYPFFQGTTDTECNPYFPISKVKDKSSDGITPTYMPPTKTGAYQRYATWNTSTVEATIRNTAITALQAFPDITGEVAAGTPPAYPAGSTATEKLKAALDPWKTKVLAIQADLAESSENTFWQTILDNINVVLSAIQTNVTPPLHTTSFPVNSAAYNARNYLINNASTFSSHVTSRLSYLNSQSDSEEQAFFGIIKLRLHQANGSFAKLKASKGQLDINNSIMNDNTSCIASLNTMKSKIS